MLHRNLVTEQAGDVSFVGVGHVGIRALADFRQPYPLSPNEALVSRAFLAGFAAKRVRRGHERRSPLARELVSRDLCHRRPPRPPAPRRSRAAGLPSRRQLLPLFRNRRRLMLVHVEQVWPSTRGLLLHAWLPPRSLNRVGLLEDERARDAKKAPNESIWLRMVVRRTLRSTRGAGQIGE